MPGVCILDALEFGVKNLPNSAGLFLQVSGLNYDVDISLNSTVLTYSEGLFLNITGKRRVSNIKVNGEDLDLDRIYNISMNDFLCIGGDGYTMIAKYDEFNESLMADVDALAFYIKNELNGSIPKEYKDFQGRINIVNASASTTVPSSTVPISTIPISTVPNNTSDFIRYNSKKRGEDYLHGVKLL